MTDQLPSLASQIAEVARQKADLQARGATVPIDERIQQQRFKVGVYQRVVAEDYGDAEDAALQLARAQIELHRLEDERDFGLVPVVELWRQLDLRRSAVESDPEAGPGSEVYQELRLLVDAIAKFIDRKRG